MLIVSCSSSDARPLLCFAGDTVPIRAVAWAPFEGSVMKLLGMLIIAFNIVKCHYLLALEDWNERKYIYNLKSH